MIENLEGTKLWNKTRTRDTIPALLKLECAHEPPKDLIKMQLWIHWPWGVGVCVCRVCLSENFPCGADARTIL